MKNSINKNFKHKKIGDDPIFVCLLLAEHALSSL